MAALDGALGEQAPAVDEQIIAAVGSVVGLIGQNWTRVGREEFISLATSEFMTLPGRMVLDALARARRRVTDGRQLVVWVCDDVEPRASRLAVEIAHLTRLATLAA